jgi:hypothetical protein
MATDWPSDWRDSIVDLSLSADEDENEDKPSPIATHIFAPKTPIPLSAITKPTIPTPPAQPRYTYVPVPEPKLRKVSSYSGSSHTQTQYVTPPTANTSRGAVNPAKNGGNVSFRSPQHPTYFSKHVGAKNTHDPDREAKRRKLSNAGRPTQGQDQAKDTDCVNGATAWIY